MGPSTSGEGDEPLVIFAYIGRCDNSKGDISSRFADPGLFVYETLDERCLKFMGNSEGERWTSDKTSPTELFLREEDELILSSEDETPLLVLPRMGPVLYSAQHHPEVRIAQKPNVNNTNKSTPVKISAPNAVSRAFYCDGTVYNDGSGWVADEVDISDSRVEVDTAAEKGPFRFAIWGEVAHPTSPISPGRGNTNAISSAALQAEAREAVSLALRSQNLRSVAQKREEVPQTSLRNEVLENSQESLDLEGWVFSGEGAGGMRLASDQEPSSNSVQMKELGEEVLQPASPPIKQEGQHAKPPWVAGPNGPIISLNEQVAEVERVLNDVRRGQAEIDRIANEVRSAKEATSTSSTGTETTSTLEGRVPVVRRQSFIFSDDRVRNVEVQRPHSTSPVEATYHHHEQVTPPITTTSSPQSLPLRVAAVPYPTRDDNASTLQDNDADHSPNLDLVLRSLASLRVGGDHGPRGDGDEWIKVDDQADPRSKGGGANARKKGLVNKDTSSSAPSTKAKGRRKTARVTTPPPEEIIPVGQSHHQPDRDQPSSQPPVRGGRQAPRIEALDDTNQLLSSGGDKRGKRGKRASQVTSENGGERDTARGRGSGRANAMRGAGRVPPTGRGGVPNGSVSPSGNGAESPGPSKTRDQKRGRGVSVRSSSRNMAKNDQAQPTPAADSIRPTEAPTDQVKSAGYRRYYVAVPPSWEA
ncbi:hypothetical protein FRB94_002337 [Tulasnella sp. JGI-2019a]|nr:hypothetical protein FRB94_002337 [Tulasnella sp. JGI-2019a]KAG9035246.1 hypothetical protein FRB95_011689 [Tulasnella sp. JGI-2019a]